MLVALDYPSDASEVSAYLVDANRDRASEYLIAPHEGILCGTGGCPYLLLDGKTQVEIGSFFGTVALLNTRINDYAVIQVISKRDMESSTLGTYVYDGERYQLISVLLLQDQGVAEWHRSLTGVSRKSPSGRRRL